MQKIRAELQRVAQDRMQQDPAHDLAHLDRVWVNARLIADAHGGNLLVLLGAAYLHDLVNLPKDAPNRAEASSLSARAARKRRGGNPA